MTAKVQRPRAIVVHDLAQLRAAFAAASELGAPVTVVSAPGAALSLGVGYFAAMISTARGEFPGVAAAAVLDCGDAPGLALAALRHGIGGVRVKAPRAALARIADIAAQSGGRLVTGRLAALDLAGVEDAAAACRAWLARPARRQD
jgi:hypothetical protein